MNKKIFGIKIVTFLQFFLCLLLAAIIWIVVQYTNSQNSAQAEANAALSLLDDFAMRL